MNEDLILGVDVGGSGIKGAIVNIKTGELVTERHRIPTPKPATPKAVASAFKDLVQHFEWKDKIGCGFPSIIKKGVAQSAANIEKSWIGTDVQKLFKKASNCPVLVLNDADVAGLAEMEFGAGQNQKGLVLLLTLGTGIGSAMFMNGKLVPNTELGHLYLRDHKKVAEKYTSNHIRKTEDLEWKEWSARFNEYLTLVDRLFTPDLYILGGGASKHFSKFEGFLKTKTKITSAEQLNNAGIVGAAVLGNTIKNEKVK